MVAVQPVWAATFTVNSTADAVDVNIGNGICRTSANTCTLRAAIQEANATLPADTIQVPAGTYQITRAPAGDNGDDTGDYDIVSPLTIVGAGAAGTIVDGGQPPAGAPAERRGLDRLLEIHESAGNVTVSGVTLREGYDAERGGAVLSESTGVLRLQGVSVLDSYAGVSGGGIDLDGEGRVEISGATIRGNATGGDGGGISNQHEVELAVTDTALTENTAGADGGGISSVSKTRLTVTRGTVSGNAAHGSGGGVLADSERASTVRNTVFTGNSAGDPVSGDGGGAGLYLGGSGGATVTGASFTENESIAEGGGLAIHSGGPVTVTDALVRDNSSEAGGGGVENDGMRVTLTRLTVTGNTAAADGGGIESQGSGAFSIVDSTVSQNSAEHGGGFANVADGTLQITGSTFWDNRASQYGGGIYNASDAEALIENTTSSGNVAQVAGGGLYTDADAGLRVVNVTINRNVAPHGAGIGDEPGGSVNYPVEPSQSVILRNTIVAGNLYSPECSFAVGSEGGNLDSADSCYLRGSRDRSNAGDPKIDAIADNGGPSMTHAIQDDSFALDGGVAPCTTVDQRGVTRPKNTTCDIGALEHEGPFPAADLTPPETSVASGPTFAAERATFTFAGTDNVTPAAELLYECRVLTNDPTEPPDPPDPTEPPDPEFMFVGCPNPYELLDIELGQNTLEVRAIDRAGNVDQSPAIWTFTGGDDITPPETTFASTPPNPSAGRTAMFSFLGTDDLTPTNLLEYECRIDSTDELAWLECASPWSFSNLTTGSHTVQVRAIDEGDNIDPTPATYTWTVGSPADCDTSNVILGADADAWVDESNTQENFGIAEGLSVRSRAPGEDARTLVRFPLPSDVPAACELTGATLRMHADGEVGRTLEAVPIGAAWAEMQVTWANQPGTVGVAASTGSGAGFREWNVTSQVAAMLGGAPNHGFLIRDSAEEGEGEDSSFASRNTVAEPPQVPQLVLRFDGPGAPQPPAPPAPVATTVTCGQVLTQSTRLLNDLTNCPLDGLVVGAPNIEIDLDGHTVDGPGYFPGQPGSPIELPELGGPAGVRNVGFENVVVTGGTVQQFAYGISVMAGSRFNLYEALTVRDNAVSGIELSNADDGRNANQVRGNTFTGNEIGVSLVAGSENSVLAENSFTGNLGVALWMQDASGHLIEENTVSGVTADPTVGSDGGFLLEDARDNRLLGNTLADTGDGGVVITEGSHRNRVEGNTMTRTGDAGVTVEDSDEIQVIGNVSHLAADSGIGLGGSSGSVVRDNDVRYNPGGVELEGSSDNLVERNDASFSGGVGISVGPGSLRNRILDNVVNGSAGGGIAVEGAAVDPEGAPLGANVVERNEVVGNQGDGISVPEAGHRLADNVAHHNAAFGIDAAEEGTIDGGGNVASGNGEPEQCRGVVCGTGTPGQPPAPDLTGPDTVLTTTPPNPSSSLGSIHFGFTGTDNAAPPTALRFQCRLDPPPDPPAPEPEPGDPPQPPDVDNWVECVSLTSYHFLFAGVHRFEVRAIDPSDNVDLTPATYTWTVAAVPPGPDSTPPSTTIFSTPDQASTTPVAVFGFRGSDNASPGPNLSYQCRLDGAPFGPCLSPKTYSGLALGVHVFEVRAVDLAGNTDPTPAAYTWTISPAPADTTPPDTTIDVAPDATTVSTDASFSFSASEAGSTFECSLDGSAFTACVSPQVHVGLWATDHEFRVRATDPAGNTDPTPAAHAWSIRPAPVPTQVSCGQTLTQSVLLTNALTNCGNDGLVVGAAGITIDLNGFGVDGIGQGVGIRNNGHDQVTVTNGSIGGFDYGLQLNAGTAGNIITNLTLTGNQEAGIQFVDADNGSAGNLVRGNTLTQNATGIVLAGGTQGALLVGNTITGSTLQGIHLVGASGNRIEENRVTGSSGTGLWLEGSSNNTVLGNTVGDNSDPAVTLEAASNGNRLEGNELTESEAGLVIVESSGNDVIANVVTNHSDGGITLEAAQNNVLRGNDVRFNSAGVELDQSSGNRIESNDASDSSSTGITLGSGSLNNVVTLNTASGNSSEGISVEAEVLPESTEPGNVIDRNTTGNNNSDGISVNKAGHRISANTANNNGGWGIYAETGNVDGGGNRATGNTEPMQCYQISCDGSAPTPPEVAPPDTLIVDEPPNPSNSTSASFTFTGIDDNTSLFDLGFECRLDSTSEAAWTECENPQTYGNLAAGTHTFQVRAVDLSDKVDPTPATYTWVVALSPPGVPPVSTISAGPTAQTAARTALFTFFANEDATFECALDGAAFADCVSPVLYEDLLPGTHEFQVRARDAEGNVEPTPATRAWTITGPPVVSLVVAPAAEDPSTTATFAFVANEPVARFECSLDLAPFTTCTSPADFANLAIGDHYLRVRAVDLDGVTSTEEEMAEHEWAVVPGPDATPPQTQVFTGPANPSTVTSASFTFSGTDNVTAPAGLLFECRLDSQNEADFVECVSPHGYPNLDLPAALEPGPHVFEVRAVDQEDNVDLTPASYSWTVAGTPTAPQTTIATAPDLSTTSTTATFTFTSSQPGSTFECALDGAAFAPCVSPRTLTGLAVGDHSFEVRAVNGGGAGDQSPAVFEWTVEPPPDTTAPETSIVGTPPATTTSPTAAFTFTANEPGTTFECSLDGAAFGACLSPANYTGLAAGNHQFRVRGTDPAGNVDGTPATYSWTVSAPPSCASPGSVTLGANADSWVLQSSSSSNYGQDSAIKVDSKSGNNARVLVRFNLPAIPSGCQVVDARLRLYSGSYKTGRTLQAIPLGATWSEANVRWNNQPATTGTAATTASGNGYREWVVPAQVGGMYANGNFGFLIRDSVENSNGMEQAFNSREKGSDNPPRLVITFG